MDVGFIGLGNLGSAMARCLLKADHGLTVCNRTRARADQLAAHGAVVAGRRLPWRSRYHDAGRCRAVESVTLEEGGVLAALNENTVHISMSTISVALSERLALEDARTHRDAVAAPVLAGQMPPLPASSSLLRPDESHHRLSTSV